MMSMVWGTIIMVMPTILILTIVLRAVAGA